MKKININESQYNGLLREYHHSYDEGLQNNAIEISNKACELFKAKDNLFRALVPQYDAEYSLSNTPFLYQLDCFKKPVTIRVYAWSLGDKLAYVPRYNSLYIGVDVIKNAIETNDNTKLIQQVYHELGHLTNNIFADETDSDKPLYLRRNSQSQRDFSTPIFAKVQNQTTYENLRKTLYLFLSNEMKARCFETAMYIKEMNKQGKRISLEDVYNDRCSGIAKMKNFIKVLKILEEKGENKDTYNIINELYYDCVVRKNWGKRNASWVNKCRKLILFFGDKLNWFKKRVDKIFYDYVGNKL